MQPAEHQDKISAMPLSGVVVQQDGENVATLVQQALALQGWTLAELAEHLEISISTLQRHRNGTTKRVTHEVFEKLRIFAHDKAAASEGLAAEQVIPNELGTLIQEMRNGLFGVIGQLVTLDSKLERFSQLTSFDSGTPVTGHMLAIHELSRHIHKVLDVMHQEERRGQAIEFPRPARGHADDEA
jgi:DNA-binding Xre family transcriptional regulator